jgi:hypothetical protein
MRQPGQSTCYVVDPDLPWSEEDIGPSNGAFEAATLIGPGGRYRCELRRIAADGAVLRTEAQALASEPASLELASGQRRTGRLEPSASGRLAFAFDEPLDIVALINRNLISQPAERRSMPRVELRAPIHVKWAEHLAPAMVRNLSSAGLQVEGDDLPPQGTLTSLYLDGIILPPAEAVWRRTGLAGFEFFEEVSWSSLIAWVRDRSRKSL